MSSHQHYTKAIWILFLFTSQMFAAQTLKLQTAIEKTLQHHPDIKTFMLRIQQAEQGYDMAYADYLPQVNASATYNPTQTYVLPVNGTFSTIDDTGWNAGLTMQTKVWDFSKTASVVEASNRDIDIAKLSLLEVKALLAYKVKSLYELLIVQREAIVVRKKDLKAKKAFYEQSLALVKQGLKTDADGHRFLSAVYVAEDNLAIAKASFAKALKSLSLYMGMPVSADVKLQKNALKKKKRLDKMIRKEILDKNYKVQMDSMQIDKNRLLHKSASKAHFGSINIVGSAQRFGTLNTYNTNTIGVNYSIPVYTGGKMSAQEEQAKLNYMISQESMASDILALKEEVNSLIIDIERYGKTIQAKKAQLRSAKSALRVLKARYKEGLATYIEVLDSTSAVLNADLGVLEAYYSRSLAFDRLAYLKGSLK